jgi:hypothetical protein
VKNFDKASCKAIAADILAVMGAIEKKYGVKISRSRGTFNSTNYTLKLEIYTLDNDGKAVDKYRDAFAQIQLGPWLDKVFTDAWDRKFQIVGWDRKAHKYPVLAKSQEDGKTYKFQMKHIEKYMLNLPEMKLEVKKLS